MGVEISGRSGDRSYIDGDRIEERKKYKQPTAGAVWFQGWGMDHVVLGPARLSVGLN